MPQLQHCCMSTLSSPTSHVRRNARHQDHLPGARWLAGGAHGSVSSGATQITVWCCRCHAMLQRCKHGRQLLGPCRSRLMIRWVSELRRSSWQCLSCSTGSSSHGPLTGAFVGEGFCYLIKCISVVWHRTSVRAMQQTVGGMATPAAWWQTNCVPDCSPECTSDLIRKGLIFICSFPSWTWAAKGL